MKNDPTFSRVPAPERRNLFQNPAAAGFLIFCCAFTARVLFFLVFRKDNRMWTPAEIGINGWLDIARNVADGKGYALSSLLTYFSVGRLVPTAARSPIPILVLAGLLKIFKEHYLYPLFIYSWSLSALTATALYFLARRYLGSSKMALVSALLYCVYLPEMNIATTYAAASESLFTLLLMLYFLAVSNSLQSRQLKWAAAAGGLLALACLSRPVVLFFPFFYVFESYQQICAGAGRRERLRQVIAGILVYGGIFLAGLAPWVIRNQIVFHQPIVTTTLGGYNLLRHNGMIAENRFELAASAGEFEPRARQVVLDAGRDINRLNEAQLDDVLSRKALSIIRRYPARYLKLCAIRTVWLWYKISEAQPRYLYPNLMIYLFLFPGLFFVFYRPHPLNLFAVHFLYFIVFHAALNVQFRFICPMMPYGIMIAVYTAASVLRGINSLKKG